MHIRESTIEQELIEKLGQLKYTLRPDIRDRAAMERNFREKFEALNRVKLTDAEFQRLLDGIGTPDVFKAAHTLRHRFATTAYAATHDLFVVAELLGHESVETTEHYVAMPDGRLREATAAVRLDV